MEQIIKELADVPIIKVIQDKIDQVDFKRELEALPDAEDIVHFLDQGNAAQRMIQLENGMKIYSLGEVAPLSAEIVENDKSLLVPLKQAVLKPASTVEAKKWPTVEIAPAVKTSQGATLGPRDNFSAGVRENNNVVSEIGGNKLSHKLLTELSLSHQKSIGMHVRGIFYFLNNSIVASPINRHPLVSEKI